MQFIAFAMAWLLVRIRTERGQDLLEYALLGGLIAAAIVAAFTIGLFSGAVQSMVDQTVECIDFQASTKCEIGGP